MKMKLAKLPAVGTVGVFLMCLLISACRAAPAATTEPPITAPATLMATSLPSTATSASANTATPDPSPTPTATPLPTATPQPITFSVPPRWEGPVSEVLAELDASGSAAYAWQLLVEEEPMGGQSSLKLVPGAGDYLVREEPLAFTVPFTTNWEAISGADADAILANGHSLVRVIPWSEMDRTNKALRVDGRHPTDPDYPYREKWSLVVAEGYEAAAGDLLPDLATSLAPLPTIRLAAVGDIMLGRTQGEIMLSTGDLLYPFANVKHIFDAADYTVGNLESALGNLGEPANKRYPLQSPPEAAQSLALAGVDLVSLANNHAQDFGPESLLHGIDLLREAGVATVGGGADDQAAHAPHVADINGLKVAFLGYVHVPVEALTHFDTESWTATAESPGLAWADPDRIREDVAAIRLDVDLVVVILHSGYEYIEEPSEPQVAAARAAVDAGADLVVGHHAHILQGIHNYRDGVIAYGLGNFVFNIDGPPETGILNVWLDKNGVRQLELIPAIVQQYGQPRLADFSEAGPILSRVYYLSTILNATPISD